MIKIDGGCHCGKLRYEAEIDPAKVEICHCEDCQVLSGTAFRVVVPVTEEAFTLVAGEPKIYIKTAESGAKRLQAFCSNCGSPIYATSAEPGKRTFGLRVGTIRQRHILVPSMQYWGKSALPWLDSLPQMPKVARE
jgi:hypothetical protein